MTGADEDSPTERWIENRLSAWERLDEQLPALEDDKPVDAQRVLEVVRQYPEIARDLAIAKRTAPNGRVTAYLEHAYARLHRILFKAPQPPLAQRLDALLEDVPAVTAALGRHIAAVVAWFVLTTAAGWWLVASFPELIALFASETMIETVQRGELWTDGLLNVTPSSVLSIQIFTNNIAVALSALCMGLLYGLGTIYIIGLNGLMLGGVFAFTMRHGLGLDLFEFVCAHGFVELSVICISGAIGFYAGEGLARPGNQSRAKAMQQRVARVSSLLIVCVVFLVGAGIIEGFVSPDERFPLGVRLAIGLGYFVLFLYALTGFSLGGGSADTHARRGGRPRRAT